MPTPSAPLHLGHAWLLFVTDTLIQAARNEGHDVDLVVVFDRICHDDAGMCAQIIEDIDRLGLEVVKYVNNHTFPNDYQGEPLKVVPMASLASPSREGAPRIFTADEFLQCVVGAGYFLRNMAIDNELGVTHVIRGFDQTNVMAVYYNLADAYAGYDMPDYAYLPIIRGVGKRKLGSHMPGLLVKDVDPDNREILFARMADICMNLKFSIPSMPSLSRARQLILGDDWSWILGGLGQDALKRQWLTRFNPFVVFPDDIIEGATDAK